jgi:pimeloyl-ACP methyl ester carboxylesterase
MPKVTVNTISLDYAIQGEGKAILLLHGLGSTKKDWDAQIPVFSQHYKTVAVDLRGHGNSSIPAEKDQYGVHFMSQDIKHLMDALEIPKATLIGFSMGGAVAFEFAVNYPERLDKLIIVNSGPDFNDMGELGEELLNSRTAFLNEKGIAELAKTIAENMFPEPHQVAMKEEFEARCAKNDHDAYYQSFVTLMAWGLGDRLQEIEHKTLIVGSDMDYTPVAFKENYTKRMKNAELAVVKNSRHGVIIDQPEDFNTIVLNFLADE